MKNPINYLFVQEKLKEYFRFRELLYFLVWKNIKIKYKQTSLGIAWAIVQPIVGSGLFTLIFGKLAQLPSNGLPYPVFYYTALLSWTFFSTSLNLAANSVVTNATLISKIYFPRLFLPGAAVAGGLLDLSITFVLLFVLLIIYGSSFTLGFVFLPIILFILIIFHQFHYLMM